jgi:hypothetical protein
MPEEIDISETQIAQAFGKVLWGLKELNKEELLASARGFAEGIPFLVTDLEAFCLAVAQGYAQAETEHQQRLAIQSRLN